MSIDSRTVMQRRNLKFESFDEMVVDAENLVASPNIVMLGHWPLSRLLTHLTIAINCSIDGISAKAPWFVRLIGPLIKRRILSKGMSAGFKLPKDAEDRFFPAGSSNEDALQQLRQAVARLQHEKMAARHPVFGRLTHDEWTKLHLRHAELHLSFAVPQSEVR